MLLMSVSPQSIKFLLLVVLKLRCHKSMSVDLFYRKFHRNYDKDKGILYKCVVRYHVALALAVTNILNYNIILDWTNFPLGNFRKRISYRKSFSGRFFLDQKFPMRDTFLRSMSYLEKYSSRDNFRENKFYIEFSYVYSRTVKVRDVLKIDISNENYFFGVVCHIVYLIHVLKIFKCDRDNHTAVLTWDGAAHHTTDTLPAARRLKAEWLDR